MLREITFENFEWICMLSKKFFILTFAKDTPTLKRSYAFTIPLAYHKLEPPQWEELG